MNADSTQKRGRRKTITGRPRKPYTEFPMYAHALGYWSTKVNGKILHFGRWARIQKGKLTELPYEAGWQQALASFKARIDDAKLGRVVGAVVQSREAESDQALTATSLCNHFLTHKLRQVEANELSSRSFREYREACDLLVSQFGKERSVSDLKPDDFAALRSAMARRWGPARLTKFIQLIRTALKHATDNGLFERPPVYGSSFEKPSKATMRKHRAKAGPKMFSADECRALLGSADPRMKAGILLALNGALGNSDVANLQWANLQGRWLTYPRLKTGTNRRIPLWDETLIALESLRGSGEFVFQTRNGTQLVRNGEHSHSDYIAKDFAKLLRKCGINSGRTFYALRHTSASVGLQTRDRSAVKALLGHVENDLLGEVYDELGVNDERLQAVVERIHGWLFAKGGGA